MNARQLRTCVTAVILSGIAGMGGAALAAPDGSEIDLKELQPAAPRRQQRSTPRQNRQTPDAAAPGSSYTVRPGDHLFLILMKRYGLSNDAAERLIPEVMRLNDIRSPKGLIVGQRLTIPLSPRPEQQERAVAAPSAPPSPKTPRKSVARAATRSRAAIPKAEQTVILTAAPPCAMARAIIEQLNLLAPSAAELPGTGGFTAHHAGLTVSVACGLAPAEAYTYTRLLAARNIDMLFFAAEDPPRLVVEKLTSHLGLTHQLLDPNAPTPYPLAYHFTAIGPDKRDVRLTITEETRRPPAGAPQIVYSSGRFRFSSSRERQQ